LPALQKAEAEHFPEARNKIRSSRHKYLSFGVYTDLSGGSTMCHVLVIEDEWIIAEHVAEIAREAGATSIDMAETEQDAIEVARLRPPAVILSDVNLAQGTGPGAVAVIRAEMGPLPVIFITGTPDDCDHYDYAAAVLSKPLAPQEITAAFQRIAPL
jgi:CheY-like chemotaxis protein